MKHTHKHKYVQIILVLSHLHQLVLCINGVANSLHILSNASIMEHFITYARCVDLNFYFLFSVIIMLAAHK